MLFDSDFDPIARMADGGGPTKTNPAAAVAAANAFVLRQESVTRMNRLGTRCDGHLDDAVAAQVALARRRRSHPIALRRTRQREGRRHPRPSRRRWCAIPMRRAVRATRQAISPRLAIRILVKHRLISRSRPPWSSGFAMSRHCGTTPETATTRRESGATASAAATRCNDQAASTARRAIGCARAR